MNINQVIADGAGLFAPKPAFQFGYPARGGEFYAQSFFERSTPGTEAEISYFIGENMAAELQAAFEAEQPQEAQPAVAETPAEAPPAPVEAVA